ncbi:Fic family protein [Bradyrhizobium sp. 182]|uniref:Fic family protein n=1 Tax=Bradyrhizobium sp. 182 TaxID=2782651 RepID=UPI001FF96CC0|nr:Fic family protein [Bradyrhizobium sp. 182]
MGSQRQRWRSQTKGCNGREGLLGCVPAGPWRGGPRAQRRGRRRDRRSGAPRLVPGPLSALSSSRHHQARKPRRLSNSLRFHQELGTHTPVAWESVPDAMEAFLDCLKEEKDPRVRAVLGQFVFTFIHPLPDGNGRTGRFLMNVMMASGGLPWTIIPVGRRDEYMRALESASVQGDVGPFAAFLADCCRREPPPPRQSLPGELQALADLG